MSTTKTTLTASSPNNVTVGNKDTDASIIVDYYGARGSSYGGGRLRVVNEGGATCAVRESSFGDDLGINTLENPITADISGTDIRLNITVDSSSVDNVTFNYELSIVKL